jgi:hypothetical protein
MLVTASPDANPGVDAESGARPASPVRPSEETLLASVIGSPKRRDRAASASSK